MTKAVHDYSPGQRFGQLTIVCSAGLTEYGGRYTQLFCCRCTCGREETLPKTKLLKRIKNNQGCSYCVRGPCVICGGVISDERSRSNTCSEACSKEKLQQIQLKYYVLHSGEDGFSQKRYKQAKTREKADPSLRERRIARLREYNKRSDIVEKKRQRYRAYYHNFREEIQTQRRMFFASLPPDEQEEIKNKRRQYDREYKRRFREWLQDNPEIHEEIKARNRMLSRERERRNALAELLRESQQLLGKK
ncbi:hypothetical protein A4G70_000056 [Salmonella enterica subsp. enterica serovar Tudu]|nr:hypothetical protein [Salmonella enterica subsp. enterica serovar Legon]EDT5168820.1 hypothetical protein [Salmonella enterica subsp. enterica serovar Tudu]